MHVSAAGGRQGTLGPSGAVVGMRVLLPIHSHAYGFLVAALPHMWNMDSQGQMKQLPARLRLCPSAPQKKEGQATYIPFRASYRQDPYFSAQEHACSLTGKGGCGGLANRNQLAVWS